MAQHPLFLKYTRDWLNEVTGFSKGYLSRVATGKVALSPSFMERVCFKLGKSEAELFLPDAAEAPSTSRHPNDNPMVTKPGRRPSDRA